MRHNMVSCGDIVILAVDCPQARKVWKEHKTRVCRKIVRSINGLRNSSVHRLIRRGSGISRGGGEEVIWVAHFRKLLVGVNPPEVPCPRNASGRPNHVCSITKTAL